MNFLGHDALYWSELTRRFETGCPKGAELLQEIVRLRGRLSFYESRIKEMEVVRNNG